MKKIVRTEPVPPVLGMKYLVVTAFNSEIKSAFIGRTGVCIEHYYGHPYEELNTILKFDDKDTEVLNDCHGQFVWRNGTEIILLEDQSYVR